MHQHNTRLESKTWAVATLKIIVWRRTCKKQACYWRCYFFALVAVSPCFMPRQQSEQRKMRCNMWERRINARVRIEYAGWSRIQYAHVSMWTWAKGKSSTQKKQATHKRNMILCAQVCMIDRTPELHIFETGSLVLALLGCLCLFLLWKAGFHALLLLKDSLQRTVWARATLQPHVSVWIVVQVHLISNVWLFQLQHPLCHIVRTQTLLTGNTHGHRDYKQQRYSHPCDCDGVPGPNGALVE